MRILIFSDIHFWAKSLAYAAPTLSVWLEGQVTKLRPDAVMFGGDLVHLHNHVDTDVLAGMSESLSTLAKTVTYVTGCPLMAMSGNHDSALRGMQSNMVEAIGLLNPDISAISSPYYYAPGDMVMIPYPPEDGDALEKFMAELERIGNEHQPVNALVHVEIGDIRYTPASSHTTDHPFTLPPSVKNVVAGHYHHPESRVVGGRNIHIVGSPLYHSYSDQIVDIPRGALVFDTESGAVERLENPYGPVYHTIESKDAQAFLAKVKLPLGHSDHFDKFAQVLLRIRVESKADYEASKPVIAELREWVESVRVIGKTAETSKAIHKEEVQSLDISQPTAVFNHFCESNKVSKPLAEAGKAFLSQVVDQTS